MVIVSTLADRLSHVGGEPRSGTLLPLSGKQRIPRTGAPLQHVRIYPESAGSVTSRVKIPPKKYTKSPATCRARPRLKRGKNKKIVKKSKNNQIIEKRWSLLSRKQTGRDRANSLLT